MFLVPRFPALEGRGEFLSLALVEPIPARCLRQSVKGSGVGRNPSFQSFVVAALILRFDSGRVLLNYWQLSIEGFARQEVFERRRYGPEILAYAGSLRRKGHQTLSTSRARSRSRSRGSESACSSSTARLMASLIERCDALNVAIALSSEPRRIAFIWPMALSRTLPPGRRHAIS